MTRYLQRRTLCAVGLMGFAHGLHRPWQLLLKLLMKHNQEFTKAVDGILDIFCIRWSEDSTPICEDRGSNYVRTLNLTVH